jgi:hypothetical protein
MFAVDGGSIIVGAWYSNFYIHGVSFYSFMQASTGGTISFYYGWVNLTGIGYGYRYICVLNSVINTGTGGVQWLPGNIDGVADASSVYN